VAVRPRASIIVVSLCLVAILAAALAPTSGDPAPGILASVPTLTDAPALARCLPAGIDIAPAGALPVDRPPARAPPVS
jgi:hypothetical protein